MDKNKLRKISKKELLEILLSQAKKIDELEEELNKTKSKLESKRIAIDESGSLAEAALKLNGIFESAEKTAKQYLLNIKDKCKKIENESKKASQIERENMLKETEELCQKKKKETDEYIKRVELETRKLIKSKENQIENISKQNKNVTILYEENKINNEVNARKNENAEKIVIEKSKKVIEGKAVKTIKKRKTN